MRQGRINKIIFTLLAMLILICFQSCNNDNNNELKEKVQYDLIHTNTENFLTYRDIKLPQEDILSLEKIIKNLSFEKFDDQQYPGLTSLFLTLKCRDREICIRLSQKAWSFWVKEKPIIRQYNGKLPMWRKYKSSDKTKEIFDNVFYKTEKMIQNAPLRNID
jgi:hypothetical protein